ncbi:OmpA family protein [Bdellovibrio sp.]|uniref:OmpA family protein n=1 Tax=Bdellovibrio sp. TaxID=28201 RepID=UPI0039E42C41
MKTIILVALLSVAPFAHANQDSATTSALEFSREEAERAPRGVLPFIGVGGGYTGYDTVGSVEGTPASIKLLGSYYFENPFVMDLGYGVSNQQFSQAGINQETSVTGGAFELAARYRWESRWQAGIVANHLFEQGKFLTAEQGDAQFVGLQVLREFNLSPSWLARLGARAQGLTNNTGSVVTMYLVDLQIGWNPGAYKPSVRQTAATENPVQREPEKVAPARPVAAAEPEPILRDVSYASLAGGSSFKFPSSRVALSTKDRQKLSRVAKALNENKDLFEKVEVHGYTDATGSASINQRISEQRANQVRSALQRGGLKDVNVVAVGKGSADSTGSMTADRRAELVFVGVKDEAKLREVLSKIE